MHDNNGPPLLEAFWRAFDRVRDQDNVLFRINVSEQSICSRFAKHLEDIVAQRYPEHRADVEYNRTRADPKRIPFHDCNCEAQEREFRFYIRDPEVLPGSARWTRRWDKKHNVIIADLVLHGREAVPQVDENLIAIEMKKDDLSTQKSDFDRCRLRRMTLEWAPGRERAIGYRYAFFICWKATLSGRQRDRQYRAQQLNDNFDPNERWPGRWGYVETFENGNTIDVRSFAAIPVDRPRHGD